MGACALALARTSMALGSATEELFSAFLSTWTELTAFKACFSCLAQRTLSVWWPAARAQVCFFLSLERGLAT